MNSRAGENFEIALIRNATFGQLHSSIYLKKRGHSYWTGPFSGCLKEPQVINHRCCRRLFHYHFAAGYLVVDLQLHEVETGGRAAQGHRMSPPGQPLGRDHHPHQLPGEAVKRGLHGCVALMS